MATRAASGSNPFSVLAKLTAKAKPLKLPPLSEGEVVAAYLGESTPKRVAKLKKPKPAYNCLVHGRWLPPHPPKTDCVGCWAAFGQWTHAQAEAAKLRPRGTAKGGGQSSKAKGRSACQVVQAALLRAAPGLTEGDIFIKATSQLGVDLHLSPRAEAWFQYGIEVKNVESLNIWQALKQAAENAGKRPAIVFFKRAHSDLYVALLAEDFLKVLPPCRDA